MTGGPVPMNSLAGIHTVDVNALWSTQNWPRRCVGPPVQLDTLG